MTSTGNPAAPTDRQRATDIVLWCAAVGSALLAGVYYAYAISVMPALAEVDDRTFVRVMREIDDAIQNPWFFAVFYGSPVLTVVAVVQSRRHRAGTATAWVTAALVFHVLGFGITAGANVPLNGQLLADGDPAALREQFETPWNAWHLVRTLATTAALGCLARALQLRARTPNPSAPGYHP